MIVPAGSTLTIEAGTDITVQARGDDEHGGRDTSRIELIVKGTLMLEGIPGICDSNPAYTCLDSAQCPNDGTCVGADPVSLLSDRIGTCSIAPEGCRSDDDCPDGQTCVDGPAPADWYGVDLDGTTAAVPNGLRALRLEHGVLGVNGYNGVAPDIEAVVIRKMTYAAIHLVDLGLHPLPAEKAGWKFTDSWIDTAKIGGRVTDPGAVFARLQPTDSSWQGASLSVTRNLVTNLSFHGVELKGQTSVAGIEIAVEDNHVAGIGGTGIKVESFPVAKVRFERNIVQQASTSLHTIAHSAGGTVSFERNLIVDPANLGIVTGPQITNPGWNEIAIRENRVIGGSATGIFLNGCRPPNCRARVESNDLFGGRVGIEAATGQIIRNRVWGHSQGGIDLLPDFFATAANYTLLYNDLSGNNGDDVVVSTNYIAATPVAHWNRFESDGGVTIRNNVSFFDARRNWFEGTGIVIYPSDLEIIDDVEDDATKGRVDFNGWLEATPGGIGACSTSTETACASDLECPADETCQGGVVLESRIVSPHPTVGDGGSAIDPVFTTPYPRVSGTAFGVNGIRKVEVRIENSVGGLIADWSVVLGSEGTACDDDGSGKDRFDCVRWSYLPGGALPDGTYMILSRATDLSGVLEQGSDSRAVTIQIDTALTTPTTSGDTRDGEIWTASNPPTLTGDVRVPPGVTLTVEAGAVISAAPLADGTQSGLDANRVELIVEGTLVVQGTLGVCSETSEQVCSEDVQCPAGESCEGGDPVVFSTASGTPAKGHWFGIRFLGTGGETSTLQGCRIEWARFGVHGATGARLPDLVGCTIDQMTDHGVSGSMPDRPGDTWTARSTVITNIGQSGIVVSTTGAAGIDLALIDSRIEDFGIRGIDAKFGTSNALLMNGVIVRSQLHTFELVILDGYNAAAGSATILDSRFESFNSRNVIALCAIADVLIADSEVRGGSNGVYQSPFDPACGDTEIEIIRSTISDANSAGIDLGSRNGEGRLVVSNSSVVDNGVVGVRVNSGFRAIVQRTNLSNNGTYAIRNETAFDVDARFNHWGATTTSSMEDDGCNAQIAAIRDKRDDPSLGVVEYCPFVGQGFDHKVFPTLLATDTNADFYIIEEASGDGIAVGPTGLVDVGDLAVRASGSLHAVGRLVPAPSQVHLATLAAGTGQVQSTLPLDCTGSSTTTPCSEPPQAIAFDLMDALFAVVAEAGGDRLITIDTATGAVADVGPLDPAKSGHLLGVTGLTRSEDGEMFAWDSGAGLLTIDTATGIASDVDMATPALDPIEAIQFLPDGRLFAAGQRLFRVNRTTGATTVVGELESVDMVTGLSPSPILIDSDGDGSPNFNDCGPADPTINPDAPEVCNGIDDNCNGVIDEGLDVDEDGVSLPCDCNDNEPKSFPGNEEICDGIDNDCDLEVDEGFGDADGDGVHCVDDCDDANPECTSDCTDVDGDGYCVTNDCRDDTAACGGDCSLVIVRPADGTFDVAVTANIVAEFCSPVNPMTLTSFNFTLEDCQGSAVPGDISLRADGLLATLDPHDRLLPAQGYFAALSDAVLSMSGTAITPVQAAFATSTSSMDVIDEDDAGNSLPGSRIYGETGNEQIGWSLANAHDVNGDGIDDFLSGAPLADENGVDSGNSYLFFGAPGLAAGGSPARVKFRGESAGDHSGFRVFGPGDVSGDGLADILISAPGNDSAGIGAGRVYVVFGSASFADGQVFELADVGGTLPGVRIDGADAGEQVGFSLAGGGDPNFDGAVDVLLGAPFADPGGRTDAGKLYLVFGPLAPGAVDLNDLGNSVPGVVYEGIAAGDEAGYSADIWIDPGGRLGDGLDDILIGSPGSDGPDTIESGRIYIINDDSFADSPVNLSRVANGQNDEVTGAFIYGDEDGARLGSFVQGIDPEAEFEAFVFVASAPGCVDHTDGTPGGKEGQLFLYDTGVDSALSGVSSKGSKDSMGTSNRMLMGPVIVKPSPDPCPGDKAAAGTAEDFQFMPTARFGDIVAAVGEVDGEPGVDIAVGFPLADSGSGFEAGRVVLISRSAFVPGAEIDIDTVALSTGGRIVMGSQAGAQLGRSLAGGGDFNGDGRTDLIAGAPLTDTVVEAKTVQSDAGALVVVSLSSPPEALTGPGDSYDFVDNEIEWDGVPGASRHNLYRGLISALRQTQGVFTSETSCLAAGVGDSDMDMRPDLTDLAVPPAGDGFYYLVTAENRIGEGSLGRGTAHSRVNDAPCVTDGLKGLSPIADRDGDGVSDVCDNCRIVPNATQLDTDNDGLGDECDVCPLDRFNDPDGDNVCQADDNCPIDSNPDQADGDGDGTGDVCETEDADGDGIAEDDGDSMMDSCTGGNTVDCDDNCPSLFNPLQTDVDANGIGDLCEACSATPTASVPIPLSQPMVSGGDITFVVVSPDGSRVVFTADRETDGVSELYSVSPFGGTPFKLSPAVPIGSVTQFHVDPSSSHVVYVVGTHSVYSVPIDGGASVLLNSGGSGFVRQVKLSPDGIHVVYLIGFPSELYSVPIIGGVATRLDPVGANSGLGYGFTPDGSKVVFLSYFEDATQLFQSPIEGGLVTRLNDDIAVGGAVLEFRLSRDGNMVVYRASQDDPLKVELYSVPITGGGTTKLSGTLPAWAEASDNPVISPDGAWVAFSADIEVDQKFELYLVPIGGGAVVKRSGVIVSDDGDVNSALFSGDSQSLVYWATDVAGGLLEERLFRVSTSGGNVQELSPPQVAGGTLGSIRYYEPANRVVFLAPTLPGGNRELFAVPADGSASATKISAPMTANGGAFGFASAGLSERIVYTADQETDEVWELFGTAGESGPAPRKLSGTLVANGDVMKAELQHPHRSVVAICCLHR